MATSISAKMKAKAAAKAAPELPVNLPAEGELPPVVAPKAKSKAKPVVEQILNGVEDVIDASTLGVDSDALSFICSLGDPSEKDRAEFTRVTKGKDGEEIKTKDTRELSRIVGYRFQVNRDIQIPDFGTTERFNGKRLNDAKDVTNYRMATAGETVDLTRVELLALMSQDNFNLEITGGDNPVRLCIAYGRLVNLEPSSAEDLPDVSLSLLEKNRSIKDLPIIDVLDYEPAESGQKFAVGKRTIRPEFAGTKFEPRAADRTKAVPRRRGASGVSREESRKQHNRRLGLAASMLISRVAKNQQG